MADSITRCPKCRTSFRVQEAHLNTARGAVRCGSCLHVFNARDHLVQSKAATTKAQGAELSAKSDSARRHSDATRKAAAAKSSAKKAPDLGETLKRHSAAPAPKKADDDDLLIDDDMAIEEDAKEIAANALGDDPDHNVFVAKNTSGSDTNLFERSYNVKTDDSSEVQDDSWALNLLDDDDSAEDKKPPAKPQNKKIPPKAPRKSAPRETGYFAEGYDMEDFEDPGQDEILGDEPTEVEKVFDFDNEEPKAELPERESVFGERKRQLPDLENEFWEEPEEIVYQNPHTSVYLEAIEPEPVEFHLHLHRAWMDSPYLWFAMCALAAAMAVAQVSYFKFDDWSRQPDYRNYYASVCGVLGCKLPRLADLSKIRIANVVVSEHPDNKGKLMVDAVLVNYADFDQPFPSLTLEFSNMRNQVMSSATFLPKEYVGGELAGSDSMPANHPIHVRLEAPDPGPDAVNYEITISAVK